MRRKTILGHYPTVSTIACYCHCPSHCRGFAYLIWHFATRGFDLDLNIMIFVFIMLGLIAHRTPMRYVIAVKRACSNISGIVFQYPFYAGIMGIMLYTGLGGMLADWMAGSATLTTLPLIAQAAGGIVNMAIPSAGGEWAVVGPTFVEAAQNLGADLSPEQLRAPYCPRRHGSRIWRNVDQRVTAIFSTGSATHHGRGRARTGARCNGLSRAAVCACLCADFGAAGCYADVRSVLTPTVNRFNLPLTPTLSHKGRGS